MALWPFCEPFKYVTAYIRKLRFFTVVFLGYLKHITKLRNMVVI